MVRHWTWTLTLEAPTCLLTYKEICSAIDTNGYASWVFSSSLPSAQRSGHSYYTASKDSSFSKLSGSTWDIGYGDGSGASGTVGTTTVEVGEVTVTSQAVELATSVSASFVSDTGSDGLIGMGFSSINTVTPKKQSTFFDNALPDLEEPVFTADLKHSEPGSYDFGIIDSSKYSGDITYTDVDNSKGFWGFTATVDGTTVEGIAGKYPTSPPPKESEHGWGLTEI